MRRLLLPLLLILLIPTTPLMIGWSQQKTTVKKRKKPPKMTSEAVRDHNRTFIQTMDENLRPTSKPIPWKHIVIHHTASEWSSKERIDRYHREKFDDPDGIEYHFLIGNGKRRPEGFIEHGRWPLQKRSIHLFKPEGAPDAITVSLVGNFHKRQVRPDQYEALLRLVSELAKRHKVPLSRITTHTKVDGRLTVCPGKYFPYKRLIKDLAALGIK